MKKHLLQHALVMALVVVSAMLVFVGCGNSKDPAEALGTYTLRQVEVIENNGSRNTWYVDGENTGMVGELMTLVKNLFGDYRYTIETTDGGYIYRTEHNNGEAWVTTDAPIRDTVKWDADNNWFTFTSSTNSMAADVHVHIDDAGNKYLRFSHHVGTTDTNPQLKKFMQDNNITNINLRYVLGE